MCGLCLTIYLGIQNKTFVFKVIRSKLIYEFSGSVKPRTYNGKAYPSNTEA